MPLIPLPSPTAAARFQCTSLVPSDQRVRNPRRLRPRKRASASASCFFRAWLRSSPAFGDGSGGIHSRGWHLLSPQFSHDALARAQHFREVCLPNWPELFPKRVSQPPAALKSQLKALCGSPPRPSARSAAAGSPSGPRAPGGSFHSFPLGRGTSRGRSTIRNQQKKGLLPSGDGRPHICTSGSDVPAQHSTTSPVEPKLPLFTQLSSPY